MSFWIILQASLDLPSHSWLLHQRRSNLGMAGVVLETLSNRKLLGLVIGVLVLQVVAFLIGGLIGE